MRTRVNACPVYSTSLVASSPIFALIPFSLATGVTPPWESAVTVVEGSRTDPRFKKVEQPRRRSEKIIVKIDYVGTNEELVRQTVVFVLRGLGMKDRVIAAKYNAKTLALIQKR